MIIKCFFFWCQMLTILWTGLTIIYFFDFEGRSKRTEVSDLSGDKEVVPIVVQDHIFILFVSLICVKGCVSRDGEGVGWTWDRLTRISDFCNVPIYLLFTVETFPLFFHGILELGVYYPGEKVSEQTSKQVSLEWLVDSIVRHDISLFLVFLRIQV